MLAAVESALADLRAKPEELLPNDLSHNDLRLSQLQHNEPVIVLKQEGDYAFVEALWQPKRDHNGNWQGYKGYLHRKELYPTTTPLKLEPQAPLDRLLLAQGALKFIGTPYLWGGLGSNVDCSGLVHLLYRWQQRIIPRDAHDQFLHATKIEYQHMEPGDPLFLHPIDKPNRITHVILLLDKTRFIESPQTGQKVRILRMGHEICFENQKIRIEGRRYDYLGFPGKFDQSIERISSA